MSTMKRYRWKGAEFEAENGCDAIMGIITALYSGEVWAGMSETEREGILLGIQLNLGELGDKII